MFFLGCNNDSKPKLFTVVSPDDSGIDFVNVISETPEKNVMLYEYYYNGGGVAAADFNNDGLTDLYFTSNSGSNKMYLNKGDLRFEDVTEKARVGGRVGWKTGVTVVDINSDGWLDFYVCYSGPESKENLYNELYINSGSSGGVPVFTEKAKEYGLDAQYTFSTQATFFDLDRDGDLDMFLSNHGHRYFSPFFNSRLVRNKRHPQFGNRLYRNDNGHFTEISDLAGIHGGGINFGLSACVSDLNLDGWPDLYVTNDFEEQDYLYLNNHNNTFREVNRLSTGHTSKFSMGSDVADFNNDLLPDLLVVDMLPETLERQKLLKGPDDYDRYTLMVDSGFHHQNMRNTLQLHRGVSANGIPQFSEIGQLAGIHKTDWSWSALMADLDNDGFKDIFITNGFLRDFTNMDFLKYTYQDAATEARKNNSILPVFELIKQMPSTKLANFVFRNEGDYTFTDKRADWGVDLPLLSFGAVCVDLDNDGDLELVTNNTNDPVLIYKNNTSEQSGKSFIKIQLVGKKPNTYALGAKVIVRQKGQKQMQEVIASRGFQSSVDYVLNFGLGEDDTPVDLEVVWPDGKVLSHSNVRVSSKITIRQDDERLLPGKSAEAKNSSLLFEDVTSTLGPRYTHQENRFTDFKDDPLIFQEYSRNGPFLSKGDVNADGLDDFYIGGAKGIAGKIFFQKKDGGFFELPNPAFEADKDFEDQGSALFDADNDGDLDLYVVSGGTEYKTGSPFLQDRFYLNDGKGFFVKAQEAIPQESSSGSCVSAADFDNDGDIDLFVGGGIDPGKYPSASRGGILRNDFDKNSKRIRFSVATDQVNPFLKQIGIVSSACWVDLNNDAWQDLIVVGDWMPVSVFMNKNGLLSLMENETLKTTGGFWAGITASDFDNDHDVDFVVGNAGEYLQWKPTVDAPLAVYSGDYDSNGEPEAIVCTSQNGKFYPVASRDELLDQLPYLRKKFVRYQQYANASVEDVLDEERRKKSTVKKVHTLSTTYFENLGNGTFRLKRLPGEAQFSKVQSFTCGDFDGDGHTDIVAVGNFFGYRVQYGISDSSLGLLLSGDGKGNFAPQPPAATGLMVRGDARSMIRLTSSLGDDILVVAKNSSPIQFITVKSDNRTHSK